MASVGTLIHDFMNVFSCFKAQHLYLLPLYYSHLQSYPSFWPENTRSKKYGQVFTVEHMSHNHFKNIRCWTFRINKKIVSLTELMAGVKAPSKTCQLFQLMCWPSGHKVPTSTNSLVELMNMVERWRQKTDYGPVVVVSADGQSRAGVYCAANACIEQVIQHGEVDVFQAVKTVRRHRPQVVENITEYKYCYDLVLHYVLHYLHKEDEEQPWVIPMKEYRASNENTDDLNTRTTSNWKTFHVKNEKNWPSVNQNI